MPSDRTMRRSKPRPWLLILGLALGVHAAHLTGVPAPAAEDAAPALPMANGGFLGFQTAIQVALQQHPLLKRAQQTAQAAGAVTDQAKARYYPQLDAYAIQTAGTIRPLSAFNIAGA